MLIRCYLCNRLYNAPAEAQSPYICPNCMDKPVKRTVEGSKAQRDIEKYFEGRKEKDGK